MALIVMLTSVASAEPWHEAVAADPIQSPGGGDFSFAALAVYTNDTPHMGLATLHAPLLHISHVTRRLIETGAGETYVDAPEDTDSVQTLDITNASVTIAPTSYGWLGYYPGDASVADLRTNRTVTMHAVAGSIVGNAPNAPENDHQHILSAADSMHAVQNHDYYSVRPEGEQITVQARGAVTFTGSGAIKACGPIISIRNDSTDYRFTTGNTRQSGPVHERTVEWVTMWWGDSTRWTGTTPDSGASAVLNIPGEAEFTMAAKNAIANSPALQYEATSPNGAVHTVRENVSNAFILPSVTAANSAFIIRSPEAAAPTAGDIHSLSLATPEGTPDTLPLRGLVMLGAVVVTGVALGTRQAMRGGRVQANMRADDYVAVGQRALRRNDLAVAATAYERAARLSPQDGDVLLQLADIMRDTGHLREARLWYERAAKRRLDASAEFALAVLAAREGKHSQVCAWLEVAVEKDASVAQDALAHDAFDPYRAEPWFDHAVRKSMMGNHLPS